MKIDKMKKMLVAMAVAVIATAASGSIASIPAKAVVKAGKGVAARAAAKGAAKETAVRGGAAFAAATARRKAAQAAANAGCAVSKAKPGQILAVGGSVAAVTAAHEIADGVQTVIESNPDGTRDFSRVAALVLFAPIAALLVWMLWPMGSLVRNWLRLRALRKGSPIEEAFPRAPCARSGRVSLWALFAVAGFALLTVLGVWRMCADGDPEGAIARNYSAEMDRHYEELAKQLGHVGEAEFARARSRIPQVVESYGAFSKCCRLVKALCMDKLGSEGNADAVIREDLEGGFYDDLYAACERYRECLAEYVSKVERTRTAMKEDLKANLRPGGQFDDDFGQTLESCAESVEKRKEDLVVGQLAAALSVGIEAACIRHTISAASRLLGRIAVRQAVTMAASGVAACADGPLPVGDAVGVAATLGCTVWSCCDIYKAKSVLPDALAESLEASVTQCREHCRNEALRIADEIRSPR